MEKNNKMKFSDIVKKVIIEQGRYEILKKTYATPKKKGEEVKPAKMTVKELDQLVLADPTTRRDGQTIKKAGAYTPWLIKQYIRLAPEVEYGDPNYDKDLKAKQKLFFEDLYKVTEDLEKFHRFKGNLDASMRDINSMTLDSLYDAVKDFSLEKEKATKDDRKEAAKTFEYPGSETIYNGPNWAVTKVSDTGQLGKDAACFFGGFNKETRWCTSAPGLSWFDRYIKDGPLYQVFNKSGEVSQQTGLPKERYQFHFPSGQFMDIDDRQINLVDFLNNTAPELKELFKPEFAKGFQKGGQNSKQIIIDYPRDASAKYIALYGFDDLFEQLPRDIKRFDFVQSSGGGYYGRGDTPAQINLTLPSTIGEFKNLEALNLDGVISELPEEIGNLKNLMFLSLPNNKNLKSIPKSVANLPNLAIVNIKGSNPDIEIPEEVKKKGEESDLLIVK